ncbi:MAG: ThuA domain-containing protein [Deltaproteobacteria bacterium]
MKDEFLSNPDQNSEYFGDDPRGLMTPLGFREFLLMKGPAMRTYSVCAATVVAVALLGACSDGSAGLGTPGQSAGSPSAPGNSANGAVDNSGSAPPAGGSDTSGNGTAPVAGMEGMTGTLPLAGMQGVGGPPAPSGGTGDVPNTGNPTENPIVGENPDGTTDGGLKQGPFKVLVLSTTLEFPHDSIAVCNQMLNELGQASAPERARITGLAPDATWTVDQMVRDPASPNYFSEITAENLAKYDVVYSNNPTGPVFTNAPDGANKKAVFQTWFETGGGWAGQHSATDFENNSRWTWWDDHVAGGWFVDHDNDNTPGTVTWQTQFAEHPILKGLASPWNISEEWYIMNRNIEAVPGFNILAKVTVSSSSKPNGSQPRPAIWTTENESGGRAFYTVQGHNQRTYAESQFRQLMLRGILWSAHRLPGGD